MRDGQSVLDRASLSSRRGTLSQAKLQLFRQYAEGISLSDLEEEITVFGDGHKVRQGIIDFIIQRTEQNDKFPLRGNITKIGSSWDGTKVGYLDEVDTLYVLNKDQVTIVPGEGDLYNFRVRWNGIEYSPSELNEQFEKAVDCALRTKPPENMQYNGYKAPHFSGIRVNGPAVTVLFRTAADVGRMEKGSMVSLDITLAIPFSYLPLEPLLDHVSWCTQYIVATNVHQPIDVKGPHVIPCRITGGLKSTTAVIEADTLHELEKHCPTKRAHILLKCLMRKVDKFNSEYDVFQIETNENEFHSTLIAHISSGGNINQSMRYGHIWLQPMERKQLSELPQKDISLNAAAAKQILFKKAKNEDFKPGCVDHSRALGLMREVITEIVQRESMFISNHIIKSFPRISKFSVRETLAENIEELAVNLLCEYDILSTCTFTHVSIPDTEGLCTFSMFLKYCGCQLLDV